MVSTINYINHPLKVGRKAAKFWWLRLVCQILFSGLTIFLLANLSRQTDEKAYFYIVGIIVIAVVEKFVNRHVTELITYHTPGYMGRFGLFENVKGHSPALDLFANFSASLLTVAFFYFFNPSNEIYSAFASAAGYTILIIGICRFLYVFFSLWRNKYTREARLLWHFFQPLTRVGIISSLYLYFPVAVNTPAAQGLADGILILTLFGYLMVGVVKFFSRRLK